MKTYTKGGRPVKKKSEKKCYRANVKMSTEQFYSLKAKAKETGVTISEYIRLAVSGSVIKQRLTPEVNDYIRKLSGMANNLNQIAKRANQVGYEDIRNEYLYLADNIDILINSIKHDR